MKIQQNLKQEKTNTRSLSQDRYNKIKQLQDARLSVKATADILGTALSTIKKVYQVASYDEETAKAAITTAYAEAMNEVIGEDEPDQIMNMMLDPAYRDSRNNLRAEQRQRLKGLLPNGKENL